MVLGPVDIPSGKPSCGFGWIHFLVIHGTEKNTLSCDFEVLILDLDAFSCDFLLLWIRFLVIFGIWSLCILSSGHFMKYIFVFAQICDSWAHKKHSVIKTMEYINIYFTILIQTVC